MTTPQSANMPNVTLLAGPPDEHKTLYHRIRFKAHDPAIYFELADGKRLLIIRDVEAARARKQARADEVYVYADFTPTGGLDGDRVIATAQATAECCRRHKITRVRTDRMLPFLYADELQRAGIEVVCDRNLGIVERRSKDAQEVEWMHTAQRITEDAIRMACERIAAADTRDDGTLVDPDDTSRALTSEAVMAWIDMYLAKNGCSSDGHIVAGGAEGGDCHNPGTGPLRSGELIIVDVFPRHNATGYHGDCTRTMVHGKVPQRAADMHKAVVDAKAASLAATRAGVTGEDVHKAAIAVIQERGYGLEFPSENPPAGFCSMPHGTGHGLGLDLKEPPLLDFKGPKLIVGDAVTVEPGLYAPGFGGVRIEDLVIVRDGGFDNLNSLHEGLDWKA